MVILVVLGVLVAALQMVQALGLEMFQMYPPPKGIAAELLLTQRLAQVAEVELALLEVHLQGHTAGVVEDRVQHPQ